ncbi:DUF423 domain-containing protein [Marilutibacter aestuarii]|uniref:DUF423 domain-containing protein n=1 Tax=Marilutibacter aestuarii TaxID=1706195 RepID=A0A508A227_9GAMM|nr:DUF423 domain-containing protein [Lysobacter aestuarii]TQD40975.1 DUF423 domain-containing protein [Lysobacter aestuarii]
MRAGPDALATPANTVQRVLAASGAVLAAMSVGLAAYASHAADADARSSLLLAAVFAFGQGLGLAALAPTRRRWLGTGAMAALLLGVLLFSGSLAGGQLLGWPTRLAPTGGSLMILAWLALAIDLGRR